MADQTIPLKISIAPFPEGFRGDMDETFQQAVQLMEATVQGAFLTGLILPPGSTLPTSNVGPVAIGNVWYFWDPTTNQYLPQSIATRAAKNYCKNSIYQIRQIGTPGAPPALVAGINRTYDMVLCRMTGAGVLTNIDDVGPTAGPDYDTCQSAIRYTVGTTVPTLGATDQYVHEHLVEGADLAPIQNEILSLSFLCWVTQPGTYSCYLTSGPRTESFCATFTMPTANTWQRIKIQGIPAIPTAGGWTYGEGTTGMYIGVVMGMGSQYQTSNTNIWNSGFFGAGTNQINMLSVTNRQMKITAMRLEASPQCGYAVINSVEQDFHDCIRYYWTSYNYQSTTAGTWGLNLIAQAASVGAGSMLFPRRMATIPAVTLYSTATNTVGTLRNLTTNVDVTAFGAIQVSQKGVLFGSSITTPASAKGDVLAAMVTADARLS